MPMSMPVHAPGRGRPIGLLVGLERIVVALVLAVALALGLASIATDPGVTLTLAMATLYGAVGGLLAVRRPRNPIGWIFLGVLLVFVAASAADAFGGSAVQKGAALPDGPALALIWVETWAFTAMFGLYYGLALVFPSGRLPSGRAGPAVRISLLVPIAGPIAAGLGPHLAGIYAPDALGRSLDNPVALLPLPDGIDHLFQILTVVLLIVAVISVLVRFRRASGIERKQLKWFVASIALMGVLVAATAAVVIAVPQAGAGVWAPAVVGYATIPPAVGIAVLRYRLYEIDRIVSRTIGWAVVSAVLVAVFAGVILVAQAALSSITESNTLAVALSTLIVASLFQPLRRATQGRVDRRFNRTRYGAERTAAAFAGRLRESVDVDRLGSELASTVAGTVEPSSVSVWLRG